MDVKICTKKEVEELEGWWKESVELPKKGYATIICLPNYYSPNTIRITVSKYQDVTKQRLYRLEFIQSIPGVVTQWSQEV